MTKLKDCYVELKWGTLKAWTLDAPELKELCDEYDAIGASYSAMFQRDTPRQKEIICEIIDIIGKPVYLHWDNKEVSTEEAKKYVMEYHNDEKV
jgi:hypothetical protein